MPELPTNNQRPPDSVSTKVIGNSEYTISVYYNGNETYNKIMTDLILRQAVQQSPLI